MRHKILAGFIILGVVLSSCRVITDAPAGTTIMETPVPATLLPTVDAFEMTSTSIPLPTETPEPTPTVAVVQIPEIIDIQSPLPGQWVSSSSMEIRGMADPTFEQNLVIRLVALDGTELLLTSTTIQADAGLRGSFISAIEYDASGYSDGMVQVFSRSAKDGSLEHLSSRMVKFGSGTPNPAAGQQPKEKINLTGVRIGQANTRLQLQAEGSATGVFENTLEFKLCGDGGVGTSDFICGGADNVIIASHTTTDAPEMGEPGVFQILAELPNGKWRDGRLVIYTVSPANGEIEHAASMIIRNGP